MCVMSVVMDKFNPQFPSPNQWPAFPQQPIQPQPWPGTAPDAPQIIPTVDPVEIKRMDDLIRTFREAVEAAEIIDRVTEQPDCVDPEKEKLLERVDALEARIRELQGTVRVRSTLVVALDYTLEDFDLESGDAVVTFLQDGGPNELWEAIEHGASFTYTVELID
jgi:hypothetical protein